ncbi:hypothetical protein PIGBHMHK_00627 [Mycoplasmopsis arginini]|nr:hypothetical protein [Mycoplasmopsis arginini]
MSLAMKCWRRVSQRSWKMSPVLSWCRLRTCGLTRAPIGLIRLSLAPMWFGWFRCMWPILKPWCRRLILKHHNRSGKSWMMARFAPPWRMNLILPDRHVKESGRIHSHRTTPRYKTLRLSGCMKTLFA